MPRTQRSFPSTGGGGGGVGGVGGPGPAKVLSNQRIDCSLGPGTMGLERGSISSKTKDIEVGNSSYQKHYVLWFQRKRGAKLEKRVTFLEPQTWMLTHFTISVDPPGKFIAQC